MQNDGLETLLAVPAMEAPEGATAVFNNPPNGNHLAWFVTTLCLVISSVCLVIRAYARCWKEKNMHKEEVLMMGSFGALMGTAYAGYAMIWAPGYYVHQWHLTNKDLVRPLWLILVYGCCYSAVLPLIKTAILMDWARVFVVADKARSPFWWCCMVLSGFQCLWGVCCIILLNLQCVPHNAIWEFYVPAKCYDLPSVMLGSAAVQVATDLAMVLLPQRAIWSLHMSWRKKIGISMMFGVGLIALVAACVRLSHTFTFSKTLDRMYFIGPLLFWAWAEMTAGFFIFSVPCLPRLLAEAPLPSGIKVALGLSRDAKPSQTNATRIVTIGGSGQTSKKRGGRSVPTTASCEELNVFNTEQAADRPESQEDLHVQRPISCERRSVETRSWSSERKN